MGDLNTFPLSMKVEGRRVVVVGGGDEAFNKARLLARTSADLVVIGREFLRPLPEIAATFVERALVAGDLDGAVLVFVADDGDDGQLARQVARAKHIPLNVVDRPAECDFYTPAIVDRAPLTVAISSEGDAPVLARLVRARIEALLPPGLGRRSRASPGGCDIALRP